MLLRLAAFEIRYQLKQPLFWLTAVFFAVMTFGATTTDSVQIGGSIGNVHRNAPYVIIRMLGVMSTLGLFVLVAFVASSILRDFERGTHELIFSRPIKKRDYLLGRFLGSFAIAVGCFSFAALGILIGSFMPWLEPERLGPLDLRPYLFGVLVIAAPNFLMLGAAFFALASRTRSMMSTYLGLIGFFVVYLLSIQMLTDVENVRAAALLDPFGMAAFGMQTRYWTVVERNAAIPSLGGELLLNRLLVAGLGAAILALMVLTYRYDRAAAPRRKRRAARAPDRTPPPKTSRLPSAPRFGAATAWHQLLVQTRLEVRTVTRSAPFIVILAFGIFNVVGSWSFQDRLFGTTVWPVTHLMLQSIQSAFSFLLVIIVTFFAGEMVWREKALRTDGIWDAMPVPTWVPLVAKQVALFAVVSIFLAVGMLALMGVQLYNGYTNLEPLLYLKGFAVEVTPFLLVSVLALFLQVASGGKFVGYLFMILFLISESVLSGLHYDHNLYRFASTPRAPYSDMNGYGHFVRPIASFDLYWALAAAILALLARLLWVRGTDMDVRARLRLARARLRRPIAVALPLLMAAFVAMGGYIFYNTNVLNRYVPSDAQERRQAEYEKKYRQYRDVPQPRIAAVKTDVDIFPAERRVEIRGSYRLVNRHAVPVETLHVALAERVRINHLELPPHDVEVEDRPLGYTIYRLREPLPPGGEMTLGFDLTVANPGFVNDGSDTSIVENGTFFNSGQYFPALGYQDGGELQDPNQRRRQGLDPPHRFAKRDDMAARGNTYVSSDSDWIDFETTVSTPADQIALAPGYLEREWTEGGRRYFHYAMDAPILNLVGYLSARWEVTRDKWNDVAIEVYHLPEHTYNVARMIDGVKKTLDYMTANFSPYQHRQVRIVEFPRYARFAQSLPNTIPFSESIGFIARLTDDDAIDYPFYVTAHEVAHQWWAHQLIGGNVQGCTMLSETLAQYSALMVMKREYGEAKMRRFLKFELDNYLRSRGGELVEEMPLELVENQPYIHYRKGSLVTYALQDYLGEEKMNGAIRGYLKRVAFQQPPYTATDELVAELRRAAGPEQQQLIDDMLARITLFENEATAATARDLGDGRYEVTLEAKARKVRADGQGIESEVPIDDWIDVGVFGEEKAGDRTEEKLLFLEKRHVTSADPTFTVVVQGRPSKAGIDPLNKLVDRRSADNVKSVTIAQGT